MQQPARDYVAQWQPKVQKILQVLRDELKQIQTEEHKDYKAQLELADATRLRLLAQAEIQYQLAIQAAKHTLDYQKKQIDNDYRLARDDARERIYAELRHRRRELKEILDRFSAQGAACQAEIKALNDVVVPGFKRERRIQPPTYFNFKINEHESRQDLQTIRSLKEEAGRKL